MAEIAKVSIPFPDFKIQDVMDPDQFDANNKALGDKVNEVVEVMNTSDASVIALDTRVTANEGEIVANKNAIATKMTIGANHTGKWQGLNPTDIQAVNQAQQIADLRTEVNTLSGVPARIDTVEGKITDVHEGLSAFKSVKDANDIYTVIEYKRGALLVKKQVLSGLVGTNYLIQTVTLYKADGITIDKTITYDITYDANGNVLSEVKR